MSQSTPLTLHSIKPPRGATTEPKRKGRGPGSGLGKTAGRGQKGQRARKSGNVRPGFEGGQMPLIRRLPKRGFTNPFKVAAQVVNLRDLKEFKGDIISPATLVEAGLVENENLPVKLLATGDVPRAFTVQGCACSESAKKKIVQAGGKVEA